MIWEVDVLLWIQNNLRCDVLDVFFTRFTHLGDIGWLWIALSLSMLIFKNTRRVGIVSLLSLAVCALITNVTLKPLIDRTRPYEVIPDLIRLIGAQKDASFPSGHSASSFAAACVYARMLPKRYGITALIVASLIAFSRLYVGVHYPTDVFGGIAIGIFSAFLVYYLYTLIQRKRGALNTQ